MCKRKSRRHTAQGVVVGIGCWNAIVLQDMSLWENGFSGYLAVPLQAHRTLLVLQFLELPYCTDNSKCIPDVKILGVLPFSDLTLMIYCFASYPCDLFFIK